MSERRTALLETTFEYLDQGITMFDSDLKLLLANRVAREMFDLPESLCRPGTPFEALIRLNAERGEYGPGDVEEQVAQRVVLARGAQAHCFERIRADGQVVEVRGVPLPGGGFVTVYSDVTERRRYEDRLQQALAELERHVEQRTHCLRESEQALAHKSALLEATVENISQGISLFDADLRLLVHNRKFLDLLELPDILGQEGTPLHAILSYNAARGEYGPGDAAALVEQRVEMARHPVAHRFQRERPNKSVIEIQGTPLPAEVGGFVTTYADVTELVRAREQAESALAALKIAQQNLIQAEKMASLGQLVAGVAHEINTPIGIALTGASCLSMESDRLNALVAANTVKRSDLMTYTAVASESTRLVMNNLTRAAGLIQSFKQVAADQASDERRRFDLAEYIDEVLLSFYPRLDKVAHLIETDCPAGIVLDSYPGALSRVLTNLLFNALIHGHTGTSALTIRIAASVEGEQVVMQFADDGRGIASEHLGRIFDPFFTTRRGSGGVGLGLAVVFNSVTSTMGGSIECDSKTGQGTRFTLRFPISPAKAGQP